MGGALLQGCGGDTVPGNNSSNDSGGPDVTIDMNTPPMMEAGGPDAAGADASDASDAASLPVLALGDYANSSAAAICGDYEKCCVYDGGIHFNTPLCVSQNTTYGFNNTLSPTLSFYDGGHILYDGSTAAQCVRDIAALPTSGTTLCIASGSAWAKASKTCFAVTTGTIPNGQGPCQSSWECANGNCVPTLDGGTQCVALADAGGTCLPNTYYDTDCSYLGSGNTGLRCAFPGDDASVGTCQPTVADNVACPSGQYSLDCTSLGCGDNGNCGTDESLVGTFLCDYYATDAGPAVDAGDGGGDAGDGGDAGH